MRFACSWSKTYGRFLVCKLRWLLPFWWLQLTNAVINMNEKKIYIVIGLERISNNNNQKINMFVSVVLVGVCVAIYNIICKLVPLLLFAVCFMANTIWIVICLVSIFRRKVGVFVVGGEMEIHMCCLCFSAGRLFNSVT